MPPLKLKTLALREVIRKKGLCSDTTDMMVPRIREELEQLAKLPGEYEVVDEEIKVTEIDGREVSNDHSDHCRCHQCWLWLRQTRGGERISITCRAGPVWRVIMEGSWKARDIFLESKTRKFPNGGVAYFRYGFVEDGVLKDQSWLEQEAMGEETFKLDAMGHLVWTSTTYSTLKKMGNGERVKVTQMVRAKRIGGSRVGLGISIGIGIGIGIIIWLGLRRW